MSKKQKNEAVEKQNNKQNKSEIAQIQETQSRSEKIFSYILIGVAVIAILSIVIFCLFNGGEKKNIAKKFTSLTEDNVYEYITYSELQNKVKNGEDFEVVLVDKDLENANYYLYCVDSIVKQYQNNEEYDVPEVIYILLTSKLSEEEQKYFTDINRKILKQPNIVHFSIVIKEYSVDLDSTTIYKLEEYGSNYFALLQKYFENNFKKIEDQED